MANSSDDVDLFSEVEDVRKELLVMTDKHLEPIDINDAYLVLEGLLGKFTTREQRVQETVKVMARKIQKMDGIMKEKNSQNDDSDSNMQEEFSEITEAIENAIDENEYFEENKYLNSLIILYPDVDRKTLKSKVELFGSNWKGLESWMIANVAKMHERKRILAISSLQLNDQTKPQYLYPENPFFKKQSDKVKSQCPHCESWKIVNKEENVAECEEVACGINYCLLCNRKDHRPFECRKNDEIYRNRAAKDTNNIFKPLVELPTSQKDGVKRFVMFPKNDMDWTNPLDILYMAAEATFLRMVDRSPKNVGNITRKSILSIEYIENQSSTASFLAKQDNFLAKGINSKERLCFHGTSICNIDSILQENFNDERIERCKYGRGHYFSEFPDVCAGYGSGLLLCRILLGTTWEDSSNADLGESDSKLRDPIAEHLKKFYQNNGREDSHSKLVKPDQDGRGWAIVVPNSDQILPAFVIKLREEDKNNKNPSSGLTAPSSQWPVGSTIKSSMACTPQAQNLVGPTAGMSLSFQTNATPNAEKSPVHQPPISITRRYKFSKVEGPSQSRDVLRFDPNTGVSSNDGLQEVLPMAGPSGVIKEESKKDKFKSKEIIEDDDNDEVVEGNRFENPISETVGCYLDDAQNKVCICPACGKQDDGTAMISCDKCYDPYHWLCINSEPANDQYWWHCIRCSGSPSSQSGNDTMEREQKKPDPENKSDTDNNQPIEISDTDGDM